jgi:hypothetical protein
MGTNQVFVLPATCSYAMSPSRRYSEHLAVLKPRAEDSALLYSKPEFLDHAQKACLCDMHNLAGWSYAMSCCHGRLVSDAVGAILAHAVWGSCPKHSPSCRPSRCCVSVAVGDHKVYRPRRQGIRQCPFSCKICLARWLALSGHTGAGPHGKAAQHDKISANASFTSPSSWQHARALSRYRGAGPSGNTALKQLQPNTWQTKGCASPASYLSAVAHSGQLGGGWGRGRCQ